MNSLYIHLDKISNSILSKGLSLDDFSHSIKKSPKNILLLESSSPVGEYEPHSGLRIVRGEDRVQEYFKMKEHKKGAVVKWIDFTDLNMLQQLSALEISELLYFGHARTPLHSPFFYKLQNNFTFFQTPDHATKIFYRYLDEFYAVLENKIRTIVSYKISERKFFLKKFLDISVIPIELLRELYSVFQEGVVLDFEQTSLIQNQYAIPMFVVEDRLKQIRGKSFTENQKIATLFYHAETDQWELTEVMDSFLLDSLNRLKA